MLDFDVAVKRRILQNRKSIDEKLFAQAVELYRDYPRTEGTIKAVAWYGQHGELAQQIKRNQERKKARLYYDAHCRWRALENQRVRYHKALLRYRGSLNSENIRRCYEQALQELESLILRKYKFLDTLPSSIVKQHDAIRQEQELDAELLNNPMERILRESERASWRTREQ